MCGIAGVVRLGKQPLSEATIALLLTGNEHRGNDASGIVLAREDGSLLTFKADIPAWKFVSSNEYKAFMSKNFTADIWGVAVHARLATKGSPRDNKNNHPMFAGQAALVHNGIIRNDDFIFDKEKMERHAETDSDVLRGLVDKYGLTSKCLKAMSSLAGSAACIAFHPKYPKKVMICRSGNPLVLASNNDWLMFSSEKNTLYKANRIFRKRWGIWFNHEKPDIAFSPMPDNTGWIVGENGLELHGEFNVLAGSYTEPNRKTFETYKERQKQWDSKTCNTSVRVGTKEEMMDAVCPTCHKLWAIPKSGTPSTFVCEAKQKGCGHYGLSLPSKEELA